MRDLVDFGRREDVIAFVSSVFGEMEDYSKNFQGVWIVRHSFWERLVIALKRDRFGPQGGFHSRIFWRLEDPYFLVDYNSAEIYDEDPAPSVSPSQLAWREHWEVFCQRLNLPSHREPFVIEFRIKPEALNDPQFLSQLEVTVKSERFFTAIREVPVPRLLASSGGHTKPISKPIGGGSLIESDSGLEGTLGGFVKDASTGDVFGVTCAHVAKSGDEVRVWNSSASAFVRIGDCVDSSRFHSHTNCGSNCFQDPQAVDIDMALIEIDSNIFTSNNIVGLGAVSEIMKTSSIPKSVRVSGGKSGVIRLIADNFGLWNELILPSGGCQCFSDLFELKPTISGPLASRLAAAFSPMVQNKDSGAWVLSDKADGTHGFCGAVIGGNGLTGYATFADSHRSWTSTSGSPKRVITSL